MNHHLRPLPSRVEEELLTALFRSTEAVRMREARRAPGTWLQCLEASMDAAEILAPAWPRPGEERGEGGLLGC